MRSLQMLTWNVVRRGSSTTTVGRKFKTRNKKEKSEKKKHQEGDEEGTQERERDLCQWIPGTAWSHRGKQPPFLVLLKLFLHFLFLFSVNKLQMKWETELQAKGRGSEAGFTIYIFI